MTKSTNKEKPLTASQRATLQAIADYMQDHADLTPTYVEVAKIRGITPKATFDSVKILKRKGYVTDVLNSPRSLRIVQWDWKENE